MFLGQSGVFYVCIARSSAFVGNVDGSWDNSFMAELRRIVNSLLTTSMVSFEGVDLWLPGAIDVERWVSFLLSGLALICGAFGALVWELVWEPQLGKWVSFWCMVWCASVWGLCFWFVSGWCRCNRKYLCL